MRVAFMGSPDFAVPSLRALAQSHEVAVVYTRPDRPRGRGRALVPTPVKTVALELGIPVLQPQSFRDESVVAEFRALGCDVACVAAYGLILPTSVLEAPRHGCINVHASLLPRHRGAAPIHRAILEGDEHAGVCIMQMEEGLDTGPYALCASTLVGEKTIDELESELAALGAEALVEVLDAVEHGSVSWTSQDDTQATYAAKVTAADVHLDPGLSVTDALRRVRASTRSARAKILVCGCVLDVLTASEAEMRLPAGSISGSKSCLELGFSDGTISAIEVRPEGKSPMEGCAWARGARMESMSRWEAV